MLNTQLEELVEMAMDSLGMVASADEQEQNDFELVFRRQLMRKYCVPQPQSPPTPTITVWGNGGSWGNGHNGFGEKTLLNG